MRPPTSTVVVVSYKPGQWLTACLESAIGEADQVILVDNGSAGRQASIIGHGLGVKVHRLERNAGFVGGVNAALRLVVTDNVALLNDDALAVPGWLASAAAALENPTVAAVGPKIVLNLRHAEVVLGRGPRWAPGDPRPLGTKILTATVNDRNVLDAIVGGVHSLEEVKGERWRWTTGYDPIYLPLPVGESTGRININGEPVTVDWVGDVINNAGSYLSQRGFGGDYGFETADKGDFDEPAERFGVTGAAMVARRATFDRLGGLARSFFAYYEDLDWSWRARLAGYHLAYEPAGVVRHVRSATAGEMGNDLFSFIAERNRLLCLVRNAPSQVVRGELEQALRGPSADALRRSLLRHGPQAVATRVLPTGRPRGRRASVFETWAGRDEAWGLPSQIAEVQRRSPTV